MAKEKAIDEKSRGLSLKTSLPWSGEIKDGNAEGSKAENLNLLVRRFKKFLKKKRTMET